MHKKTKIFVVGNGVTAIGDNHSFFINHNTGQFLIELNQNYTSATLCQFALKRSKNLDLLDFDLRANGIDFIPIMAKSKTGRFIEIFKKFFFQIRNVKLFYLFYPGSLSTVFALLCILTNRKYALYVRGEYFDNSVLKKLVMRNSLFILTVSPEFTHKLGNYCEFVGIIKPMISITNEMIETKSFQKETKNWNFLFVGRVEVNKGINEILQIIDKFEDFNLHYTFDIVGGGKLFPKLVDMKKKNVITSNVILHGQVDDEGELFALYQKADAFIFPSYNEGFPRVLYEAMSKELLIFTTMVGGIPGRMKDGFNCVEIPVKNGEKAAEIILKTIKKHEVVTEIRENGRKTLEDVLGGKYLSHSELLINFLQNEE